MSTEREVKTCPDCAEEVLAAARVCRYCGYRFQAPAASPATSSGGGLLDMIRVPSSPIDSVPELVAEWGITLWPDETVREDGLCFAEIDGELGYVLLTSSRLRFVVARRGRRADADVRLNRELRDLRGAVVERRRLRRVAVLRWDDGELLVHVESGSQAQLVELLTDCPELSDRLP